MRTPYYVWSDGETVTIGASGGFGDSVRMPEAVLEELAVMVVLELLLDMDEGDTTDLDRGWERLVEVAKRAHEKHGGNFGADGVAVFLNEPSTLDRVREAAEIAGVAAARPRPARRRRRWLRLWT